MGQKSGRIRRSSIPFHSRSTLPDSDLGQWPPHEEEGAAALAAPLLSFIPKPAEVIEGAIGVFLGEPRDRTLFPNLWQQLEWNLLSASGINPEKASSRAIVPPTKTKDKAAPTLVSEYLGRTPLQHCLGSLRALFEEYQ